MHIHKSVLYFIFPILFASSMAYATTNPDALASKYQAIEKKANKITSMDDVKQYLRTKIIYKEKECGTGSCIEAMGNDICDYIALVDISVNGSIINTWVSTTKKPAFQLSQDDKDLLSKIYESCKMSNYQYWTYPTLGHITFLPSQSNKEYIYQKLNLAYLLENS